MNDLLPDLKFNKNLTPDNAKSFGYEWIQDIIYDREAPFEAMKGIIKMFENEKYVLGNCASLYESTDYVGLYKEFSFRT